MTTQKTTYNPFIDRNAAIDELALKHQKIEEKYKNTTSVTSAPGTNELIAFNGYYALDVENVDGAFLTIDTNMHIKDSADTPILDVDIIIYMGGSEPITVSFEGPTASFSNNVLTYGSAVDPNSPLINLTFSRPTGETEVTARIEGTIQLPLSDTPTTVTGKTYNNPIEYRTYIGKYHTEILDIIPWTPVLDIADKYKLSYNFDTSTTSNKNKLTPIPTYTYNLNMYFFSINNHQEKTQTRLIMGTSPEAGLVCNNMTVDSTTKKLTSQRSIQTVRSCEKVNPDATPNSNSQALGEMSGFYPLPDLCEGAFVCIEGEYIISEASKGKPVYSATIGVCTDGETSTVYTFDDTMNYENGVLTINTLSTPVEEVLNVTLSKAYQAGNPFGYLTSMSGTIYTTKNPQGTSISSSNPLNPVPLKGFAGAKLTNTTNATTVEIIDDFNLTYEGHPVTDITYVPVMYIAAFKNPTNEAHTIVLSLGSDGQKGTACIVTDVIKKFPPDLNTTAVWALPTAATPSKEKAA